jgi:signal transduction histidine kinase
MIREMTRPELLLAQILQESRAEITAEWGRLLSTRGLPYQRRIATEPESLRASFDNIIALVIDYLYATDDLAREEAKGHYTTLYRELGRRWAQEERALPEEAIGAPRIVQAIVHVLLSRWSARLAPEELLDILKTLNTLAMDLSMARVYGYMRYKEEELAAQRATVSRLLDELTHVETKERRSLALDLHDSLAQRLVSLFNGIQHAERLIERDVAGAHQELTHLKEIAQDTIRDARSMIRDLHFGVTGQNGGFSALAEYLEDLEAETGVPHNFRIVGATIELSPARESLVIRIIQEAVINAHKHADADRIEISVNGTGGGLEVVVRDNGRGFDVEAALARSRKRGRFGLVGMQERAQLLGATLSIESAPGRGATIRLLMTAEACHD